MYKEALFFGISWLISVVIITMYVYWKLEKPFTLYDVLFGPDWSDSCEVYVINRLKWIPVINIFISIIFVMGEVFSNLITKLSLPYKIKKFLMTIKFN